MEMNGLVSILFRSELILKFEELISNESLSTSWRDFDRIQETYVWETFISKSLIVTQLERDQENVFGSHSCFWCKGTGNAVRFELYGKWHLASPGAVRLSRAVNSINVLFGVLWKPPTVNACVCAGAYTCVGAEKVNGMVVSQRKKGKTLLA